MIILRIANTVLMTTSSRPCSVFGISRVVGHVRLPLCSFLFRVLLVPGFYSAQEDQHKGEFEIETLTQMYRIRYENILETKRLRHFFIFEKHV